MCLKKKKIPSPLNHHIKYYLPTHANLTHFVFSLLLVMGAFLLCWLPFFSWYLTVTICGEKNCPCPDIVVSILFWIGYFNSTLNPLIYVMTNRDFKDAFTDILRRIFCFCCPDCVCCSSNCCSCCFAEASNANPECAVNSNLDYV